MAQQFGMAIVVELIIAMCLVVWDVLGRAEASLLRHPGAPTATAAMLPAVPDDVRAPQPTARSRLPAPPRPTLALASAEPPAGSVPEILAEVLEPASARSRIEFEEAHAAYALGCKARGKPAVEPEDFVDPLQRFCTSLKIKTKLDGAGNVYLLGVRLAKHAEISAAEIVAAEQGMTQQKLMAEALNMQSAKYGKGPIA